MTENPTQNRDRDEQLGQVLAEWLEAAEQGRPPDESEYLRCYPEFGAELAQCFADWKRFPRPHRVAERISPIPEPVLPENGLLGDFRIVREVGRGGMGVVYEAEQVSLGRRVALKVLPFAATMDPRHLQRFHNEARAAASLHHEHIVPVHGVGCERGVHYYAMQLIDGQSLDAFVRQRRRDTDTARTHAAEPTTDHQDEISGGPAAPTTAETRAQATTQQAPRDAAYFRRVAEWGIAAAEALEYAHSLGIIHRDIKPANLMIDGAGKLWITDFGLARTVSNSSLTQTGDLLGTFRYMSPEQALAKHGLVDHRTDIYSLAMTLYELLTLRPAIEGEDREEILRQIAFEEPSSPRSLDRAIPADLETIVLKALAKEPAERYATAQALADDLRYFLEARPIRAKRPTVPQRLWKWGQRHRHLVGATALFLVLGVVGLAVSAFLLWREQEQTKTALAQAQANYAQAEAQRQRAEANFREAFWLIEDLLMPFDEERNGYPLSVAELRRWQTERSLRFLGAFAEDQSDEPAVRLQRGKAFQSADLFSVPGQSEDPVVRLRRAIAFEHAAMVYQVCGEREKTRKAVRQAAAILERLVQDFPDNATYRRELVGIIQGEAAELYRAGQIQDARTHYIRVLSLHDEAARNNPTDAEIANTLAVLRSSELPPELRDPEGAVRFARKAVELAPDIPRYRLTLGIAYYRAGDWPAAVTTLEEFLQMKEGPWTRTRAFLFLAMARWQRGKEAEASDAYQQAVQLMESRFDARGDSNADTRAEAAALLGIPEPPTPKAKEQSPRKE
jgi:serine/threonine protein kinase